MKIGILTFHRTTNYGANLQCYALSEFLKQKGHYVEVIDYYPETLRQTYQQHLYGNKFLIFNALKDWKSRNFLRSHAQLSSQRYSSSHEMQNLNQAYDLVICGSDEIWNISSSHINFDKTFFLNFISNKNIRKASYAASFGFTEKLAENANVIHDLLQDFFAISVRDKNSLRIVTEECRLKASKVVDPTFLLQDYSAVTAIPKIKQDYILIYGGLRQNERNYVKAVADSEGLDTVAIGYPCKTARKNKLSVSPEEWLGYFANASYVYTNFYHGAIFSLIFKKPFTFFSRKDKSVKIQDLLGDLDLSDRIISENLLETLTPELITPLNFNESKLNEMINDSKTYLSELLNT